MALLARFLNTLPDGETRFSDIPASHWAVKYAVAAEKMGWVTGYQEGSAYKFYPERDISRAEAIAIMNRCLNRRADRGHLTGIVEYPDNLRGAWYYYEIVEATNAHDYTRPSENTETWTSIRQASVR